MDKLDQHCGELPDDQFAWVLFATLRFFVPTRGGSPWLVRTLSPISNFDNLFVTMSQDPASGIRLLRANPKEKAKGKANAALGRALCRPRGGCAAG